MANIVVTSDTSRIYVEFNDYASNPNVNTVKSIYPHTRLNQVSMPYDGDYVLVIMSNGSHKEEWGVSFEPVQGNTGILVIDSVNGTTPTDLDNLYDLLGALIL